MSTTSGMFGYYPAPNEHPQSIAHRTAALATLTEEAVCVVYAGQMFTTSGDEETLLQQLLAAQQPSPYQAPSQPPYGMGCMPR